MDIRKVLMMCKGNICRSPIAEAVFQDIVNKADVADQWFVDSAGMDDEWKGSPPDPRSRQIMKKYGLAYTNTSRPLIKKDFFEFEYILGMDQANIDFLDQMKPNDAKAKCFLLGDFGLPDNERIIRDPYLDKDLRGFEEVYQKCLIACAVLFKKASANQV